MASGKFQKLSPIVLAISEAETRTTGEIRVHISRGWAEKDVFRYAQSIFEEFDMQRTAQRNAILIYLNLRTRKFAILGDRGIDQAIGPKAWEEMAHALKEDLLSTHFESAIAMGVQRAGACLAKHFPAEQRVDEK